MPLHYDDRGWTATLEQLPDVERRRLESSAALRAGTALTDSLLMTSRDGVTFNFTPETFLTPGPERSGSWMYGDSGIGWHLVETTSAFDRGEPELSLYSTECYRLGPAVKLRRYTLRLDGFASIHAPIAGGEIITPAIRFRGKKLLLNFATSASGSVKVEIQDENGRPIPGFALSDCIELYGDTTERAISWQNNPELEAHADEPVHLRFVLKDADLYSFKFE
jgi:hypothetical protein